MAGIILILFLVFFQRAHSKKLVADHIDDLVDNLVDKLIGLALKGFSRRPGDLKQLAFRRGHHYESHVSSYNRPVSRGSYSQFPAVWHPRSPLSVAASPYAICHIPAPSFMPISAIAAAAAEVSSAAHLAAQPSRSKDVNPAQQKIESLLATLHNPRVRDVAWAVANPSLCCSSEFECQEEICTDASIETLFDWDDLHKNLQDLDNNPDVLLQYVKECGENPRSQRTGLYYENLVHFALKHFSKAEIMLVNEAVLDSGDLSEVKIQPLRVDSRYSDVIKILDVTYHQNATLWIDFVFGSADNFSAEYMHNVALEFYRRGEDTVRLEPVEVCAVVNGTRAVFTQVPPGVSLHFHFLPNLSTYVGSTPKKAKSEISGEVDFILRPKTDSQNWYAKFLHLEVAVVFYCASRPLATRWEDFLSPDIIDKDSVPTLGAKLRRMLDKQLHKGQDQHIRSLLAHKVKSSSVSTDEYPDEGHAEAVAAVDPQSIRSMLSMNGRLFYRISERLDSQHPGSEPWHEQVKVLDSQLETGWWCLRRELGSVLPAENDNWQFAILKKPFWLAPLIGDAEVIEADHGPLHSHSTLLLESESWCSSQLIAVLHQDSAGVFSEVSRGFVLKDTWPKDDELILD
eukprot:gnl/MRDRNA2_/MRDRNA2_56174_c0_seq1.p1 gnl/MRDRNA2_/MRDRNA2_56174_c0~~gnl/MRDRNA2_/MRDRNA2_56174_c0_seq1.p1  ORF type:complete len:627 (-),score=80.14 gnl/MRDRNA2_/MRDRNA2_56174_c0_seq1:201-2081(-)